jgi:hypothetical protein
MLPRLRVFVTILSGSCLLAIPCLRASDPATLDDVVALLKAGVGESIILKEMGSAGPKLDIGVREVLKLKEAGASDHLIESLMGEQPPAAQPDADAAAGSPRQASYRVFMEKGADGKEVLHVTNLDASGRRMGGEVAEKPDVPNRYDASGREDASGAPGDGGYGRDYQVIGDPAPQPPVIVNVYPPSQTGAGYGADYGAPSMYPDPYAYGYAAGFLPGYRSYGYFGTGPVYAPPGSWTHFRTFHSENAAPPRPCPRPTYAPIGPAIGYDMYYRHTQRGFPR